MESKVVSVGPMSAPAVRRDDSHFQPAWMNSSILAVAITAFIALSAIVGGQWAIETLGIDFGWVFVIAGFVIAAEMYGLYILVTRVREAYQRKHREPPTQPLNLAA